MVESFEILKSFLEKDFNISNGKFKKKKDFCLLKN